MKYIDMHCDSISRLHVIEGESRHETLEKNKGHLDLDRMKAGGCLAQNFALFTFLDAVREDPYGHCMALCDRFKQEMQEHSHRIAQVRTVQDILENDKKGIMSAVLTIEEGAVCMGDTGILGRFYEEGVRMMTLTWNFQNELAWPNRIDLKTGICIPETEHGLTKKGFEFVELMEELGMVVDVSHLGDAGFWDVVKASKRPFAASHSNARGMASHVRNLTDDMIRTLAERGGVMGINFGAAFLSDGENGAESTKSRISDMIRHIRYIKNLGGIECIGLGSDYDGIVSELELTSPADFPKLSDALLKEGFTETDVEKIFYKNVLRLYTDVWK